MTPGASSSSPGLAFLLATVAKYGDAWPAYWEKLMANGTKITSGWSDAYEVDFTAGGGGGDRPIVLSYASSPPFTIPKGASKPTTSALLDTCFRQVEYAGVLDGRAQPEGRPRRSSTSWSRSPSRRRCPTTCTSSPSTRRRRCPADWAKYAKVATKPYTVAPAEVAKNRDTWLREWSDVTTR